MAGKHFLYGLELAGPYMFLLGGSVYALLHGAVSPAELGALDAMLVMVISVASLIPKISMAELGVPVLWYGLQIAYELQLDGISRKRPP